jgi:hypothetical protein
MKYGVVLSTVEGRDFNFELDTPKAVRELIQNSHRVTGVQIWDESGEESVELSKQEVVEFLSETD